MLPFLRNKAAPPPPQLPAWHPNFRNFEKLPDTKVVRTSFFINGLTAVMAAGLLLLLGYQEYGRHSLRGEVAQWEERVAASRAASTAAVAEFKLFQTEEKKLQEAVNFTQSPIVPTAYLLHLGETLPSRIAVDYFDLRATGITLRASILGQPSEASGIASAFVQQLQEDAVYGAKFANITLTSLARNAATGQITIEVALKFGASKKP